jgi:branched-chain amino acid transport system permease protein
LNLAHSAVFMIGAVVAYSVVALHGGPFWLAVVAGLAVAGGLGVVIEYGSLRPLRRRGAPPLTALVSTIGLALVLVSVIEQARGGNALDWLWRDGANSVRFPRGSVPDTTWHPFDLTIEANKAAILVVTVVLMAALAWLLRRTGAGRAMRAVAENPRAARYLGIDVNRVMLATLVASSALAGLAGILYGLAIGDISPYIGRDQVELRGLAVIVLGGMGSIVGSVVGGYVLGIVEVVALLTVGANFRAAVAFGLLFVMLVVRPQGLLGPRVRERI